MSFLSRFFKPKDEDNVLEGIEDSIEEDEQEGLLMSTESQRSEPAAGLVQTAPAASAPPAIEEGDETLADLVDATVEPAEDESPEAEEDTLAASELAETPEEGGEEAPQLEVSADQELPDTGGLQVQTVAAEEDGSGAKSDDLLSAFRDTAVAGHSNVLMEGLEDVPASDLLSEARELRGLLPQQQTDGGSGKAGGDGQG